MFAYLYRKLSIHRGAPRLWLEGKQPARGGFSPGVRYHVTIDKECRRVTLSVKSDGQRVVSVKERRGERLPIIDINSREVLSVFEGIEVVRVVIQQGKIHIVPGVAESKRRERLERIASRLGSGQPLAVGSLAHGIGVLSHALHKGLEEGGVSTTLAFANEIRDELVESSYENNDVWSDCSTLIAAPMQELAIDRWAMDRLPQVDILEAGLPCSGASVAGRAKLKTPCAEAHPHVGALVVPFIQVIQAVNPAIVLLENVPTYRDSGSMWILRNALRDLGYDVHESNLDAADFNELEHRTRMCMVAVTTGMSFNFEELERPPRVERKLGEILEAYPEDAECWKEYDYLKQHVAKHAAKGNGFALQLFGPESDHIGTIGAGYAKVRATEPKITHPSNPNLMRQITQFEHSKCKGVDPTLIAGLPLTTAHEALGQGICYSPFKAVGLLIAKALKKPIDSAARVTTPDLLAAA